MATYTLNIDEHTRTGKNLIEFLKSLEGVVSINSASKIEDSTHDLETEKANKSKNVKDVLIENKQRDEHSQKSAHNTAHNSIQMPKETGSINSLTGIWKDYDISIETIREKSWNRI